MVAKNAGGKNEGMSHDIIENTCRKNVSFMPCHDVDENKAVIVVCHDLDENKGVNRISGKGETGNHRSDECQANSATDRT